MKKDRIVKIGAAVIASALTINLLGTPAFASEIPIDQTGCTIATATTITFKNKELENIIKNIVGNPITAQNLSTINKLEIPALSNQDLSDLSYLTNLEVLIIKSGNVDCANLASNSKLRELSVKEGTMYNTKHLPENLRILNLCRINILDDSLHTPSNLSTLILTSCTSPKISISNPTYLTYFYHNSYDFLDLNDLKDCCNLRKIIIKRSPNVLHGEVLSSFNNVTTLTLDEHSILWLNCNTLASLPITNQEIKTKLVNTSREVDNIVSSLGLEGLSEVDKLNSIILYVINQIEYDNRATENTNEGLTLANYYNDCPISSAIHGDLGVCVSYTTLFTALANRIGLDNYQVSSYIHAWNMVRLTGEEYKSYDLTGLDKSYTAFKSINESGVYDRTYNREVPTETFIKENQTEDLFYYGFVPERTTDNIYLNARLPLNDGLTYSDIEEPQAIKIVNKTLQKRYKK